MRRPPLPFVPRLIGVLVEFFVTRFAALFTALLLAVGLTAFPTPAVAEDEPAPEAQAPAAQPPPPSEIWHFRKGDAERTVDVTGLDELVREAVLARMRVDGFQRVKAPAPGRDLAADARELVERGGRFVQGQPGVQSRFLGASVRLESAGEAAWLRVLATPRGSLARALGLVRGDRIPSLGGEAPTLALLRRYRDVEHVPGQLALRVLRREGGSEDWTLTFARGPAPAGD